MRNRTRLTFAATLVVVGAVLGVVRAVSVAQTPPPPLDPVVERTLRAESFELGDSLAVLVESLAAGTPAIDEFSLGRLRTDERARVAFVRRLAPGFQRIIDSAQFREAYARRRAEFTQQYRSNPHFARSLERYFPADPRQLVADGIRNLNEQCGDVNFRAATRVDESGRRRFVDPANEGRPRMWKLCFRIGARAMTEIRRSATRYQAQLAAAGITPRPSAE